MPLQYKTDIIMALKDAGYTTYVLRRDKMLGESTIQKLREGQGVSWENLETLCRLLKCDIGDICVYIPEEKHPE